MIPNTDLEYLTQKQIDKVSTVAGRTPMRLSLGFVICNSFIEMGEHPPWGLVCQWTNVVR